VVAAPNLKNKDKILAEMDKAQQPNPQAQQVQQITTELQVRGAAAKIKDTEASAQLKTANAAKAMREAMTPPAGAGQGRAPAPQSQDPFAAEAALADIANTVAGTELKRANTARVVAQTQGTVLDNMLAPFEATQPVETVSPQGPSQVA